MIKETPNQMIGIEQPCIVVMSQVQDRRSKYSIWTLKFGCICRSKGLISLPTLETLSRTEKLQISIPDLVKTVLPKAPATC